MIERPISRALPVLDLAPRAPGATARHAPSPQDERLAEFRPEEPILPTFHLKAL